MTEALQSNRLIYGVIRVDENGRSILRVTAIKPSKADGMAFFLWRGEIADGLSADIPIISDPSIDPELRGAPGSNGWTPVLKAEADGTRTLANVMDWERQDGKPATGYLSEQGLVQEKTAAFNFNAVKRVRAFSGPTNPSGIATISFAMPGEPDFAAVPQVIVLSPNPNVGIGRLSWAEVPGSRTKTSVQVKVEGSSLLSGLLTPLAGATANVIVIEI